MLKASENIYSISEVSLIDKIRSRVKLSFAEATALSRSRPREDFQQALISSLKPAGTVQRRVSAEEHHVLCPVNSKGGRCLLTRCHSSFRPWHHQGSELLPMGAKQKSFEPRDFVEPPFSMRGTCTPCHCPETIERELPRKAA